MHVVQALVNNKMEENKKKGNVYAKNTSKLDKMLTSHKISSPEAIDIDLNHNQIMFILPRIDHLVSSQFDHLGAYGRTSVYSYYQQTIIKALPLVKIIICLYFRNAYIESLGLCL